MKRKVANKKPVQPLKSQPYLQVAKAGNSRYKYYLILAGILILTCISFSTSVKNNFTNFDDEKYVLENNYIKNISPAGIKEMFKLYSKDELPLTYLSMAIDYHFWKLNPHWYHIENLFWHLLNIILVFFLIELLTKRAEMALFVALFFAIHPTRCESVAWVAERKDVLYAFFYLLTLMCYIKYITKKNKLLFLPVAILLFFLSILSKYSAVILPLILFAIDYFYSRKLTFATVLEKLPFIAISAISTTFHFIAPDVVSSNSVIVSDYHYYDRIFFGCYAIIYYIVISIIPFKLSLIHPYPKKVGYFLPLEYYVCAVIVIIIIVLLVWLLSKKIKHKKDYIFGIILFFVPLTLVLHIIPFGGNIIVGERYSYISFIGLFFIFGGLFCKAIDSKTNLKIYAYIILSIFTVTFTLITFNRNKVWKDSISLWSDVVEKYPCVVGYNNLGTAKMLQKDYEGAIEDFNKAIEIKPEAFPYLSRGVSRTNLKDFKGAIADFNIGIKMSGDDYKAYDSRANALIQVGDLEGALNDYNKVIELKPDFVIAYNNRGIIKFNLKNYPEAIKDYLKAIELDPNFENAYTNLGSARGMMKDYPGSIEAFSKAIELNNKNDRAYNYRAFSNFNLKKTKEACEDWKVAAQLGNSQSAQMLITYCK